MKKILTILLLFCCVALSAQTQFTRSSPVTTPMDPHLRAGLSFGLPIYYTDTSEYNGLDSLGTEIYVAFQGVYLRDTLNGGGHYWVLQLNGNQQYWTLNSNSLYPNSTNYNVGIGTSTPASKLQVLGAITLYDNATRNNVLLGQLNGANLTTTYTDNILIGGSAGRFATGNFNMAIGTSALQNGNNADNTAVGYKSLYLTDSTDNTALGYLSGLANYGAYNTSIGSSSGNYLALGNGNVNNSEIVTSSATMAGSTTATFISGQSLTVGQTYPVLLHFNGTPPEPYNASGITDLYTNVTVTASNTLMLVNASNFTTTGTSTTTITVYNKQFNSIAIGYNARSTTSNQIMLGNANNTRLQANTFIVDITDVPTTGQVLIWQPGGYAAWDTISGGGGSIGTFIFPLVNSSGIVSIVNATTSTAGVVTPTPNDFDMTGAILSIDYINGQASDPTHKGFLTSTAYNTFLAKQDALPSQTGNAGKFLTTNGSVLSWGTVSGGGITSLDGATAASQTFAVGTTGSSPNWSLSGGSIHSINIPTTSTLNTGLVTPTLYNTWNAKQDAITGGATTITSSNLTSSRVLVSNGSGKVDVSGVTSTTLTNLGLLYTSQALTDGATITMNCNNGYVGTVTINGNRNITFTNVTNWFTMRIKVTQGAAGNFTLTFPANTIIPVGFGSGTTLNLSTTGGAVDMIFVDYNGSDYMVTLAKDYIN